jgi:hypothetical protein
LKKVIFLPAAPPGDVLMNVPDRIIHPPAAADDHFVFVEIWDDLDTYLTESPPMSALNLAYAPMQAVFPPSGDLCTPTGKKRRKLPPVTALYKTGRLRGLV